MNGIAALSDPTRQRIVEMLSVGPLSSGDIAQRFEVSAPAISQHLKTLRVARLVRVRAAAQRRIYELDPEGIAEISQWLERIKLFWSTKLDALETQLKHEEQA